MKTMKSERMRSEIIQHDNKLHSSNDYRPYVRNSAFLASSPAPVLAVLAVVPTAPVPVFTGPFAPFALFAAANARSILPELGRFCALGAIVGADCEGGSVFARSPALRSTFFKNGLGRLDSSSRSYTGGVWGTGPTAAAGTDAERVACGRPASSGAPVDLLDVVRLTVVLLAVVRSVADSAARFGRVDEPRTIEGRRNRVEGAGAPSFPSCEPREEPESAEEVEDDATELVELDFVMGAFLPGERGGAGAG